MEFEERFDELAGLAYRVAFRVLGDRALAEEVAQEALTRGFVRWSAIQGHARAWVARVASNEAIGILRRQRRLQPDSSIGVDESSAVIERLELQRLLLRLPRRQRQVVMMRYLADLSEADVARGLGCSVGAVKRHAHRGLNALRAALSPGLSEEMS